MPSGHPYGEDMKQKILECAKNVRFIKEIAKAFNIFPSNFYPLLRTLNIYDDVEKILQQNRLDNPILLEKYSKELMLNIAGTSTSMAHMGRRLHLCRERIRQICVLYKIEEEIEPFFKPNRERAIALLENSIPLKIKENKNEGQ